MPSINRLDLPAARVRALRPLVLAAPGRRRTPVLHGLLLVGALIGGLMTAGPSRAAVEEETNWLAWFNTTRFDVRWGLVSDVQVRSRDDWDGTRNLLLRAGLSYRVNPQVSLMAGYAHIDTYPPNGPTATEHRPWQQLVVTHPLMGAKVAQRFRLEQRFIGRPNAPDAYVDRLRWFARSTLPFGARTADGGGAFVALQNEIMFNLSGRDELPGRWVDQNRAYVALGWRLAGGHDIEVGYLNQWVNGVERDTVNHVLQIAFYSQTAW